MKFKIYVTDAVNATRTIVAHYRVSNGLSFYEDHDELYWNITGNDWDEAVEMFRQLFPCRRARPEYMRWHIRSLRAKKQDAKVTVTGTLVDVQMQRTLEFHEGVSVVVGWDKGFVRAPTKTKLYFRFLRSNWPFVVPVIVFFAMFWLWYTKGRDPRETPLRCKMNRRTA